MFVNDSEDACILIGALCNGVDLVDKKLLMLLELLNRRDFTNISSAIGNIYSEKLKYSYKSQSYNFTVVKMNQDVFNISFENVVYLIEFIYILAILVFCSY